MTAYSVEWRLSVTAAGEQEYLAAVNKVRVDADRRLAEYQENWLIAESPETLTVSAQVTCAVDDLDAAG